MTDNLQGSLALAAITMRFGEVERATMHPGGRSLPKVVWPQLWYPGQSVHVRTWKDGDTWPNTTEGRS